MKTRTNARPIYKCSANKRMRRKAGFSLIELLIAIALIAVVAAVAYGVIFQGFANYAAESEMVDAQSNVRYGLTYLSRQIRKGETVSVGEGAHGTTLYVDYEGNHYQYFLYDHKIWEKMEEDGGTVPPPTPTPIPPVLLVARIGGMSISQSGNRITITITSEADSRGNTVTETMDIYLRE